MKKLAIVALLPVFLFGCGKGSGNEFIGHWTKVSGQGPDITIVKRGDMFVIQQPNYIVAGQLADFPAELKDGALEMPDSMGITRFVIDKTTGHLMQPGEELQRAAR